MVNVKLNNKGNIVVNNYTTSVTVSSGESAKSIEAKVKKAAALAKKNKKASDNDVKILFAQAGKYAKQLENQAKKIGKAPVKEKEKPEKKKEKKPPAKKEKKPPAKKKEKKAPPKKKEEKAAPPPPTFGAKKEEKKEPPKKEKKAPPKPVPIKPTGKAEEKKLDFLTKKEADKLIEELEMYEAIVADFKISGYANTFKRYKQLHESGALTKEDQKKFEAFKKEIDKVVAKIQKAEEKKVAEAEEAKKEIPVPKINWDMQLPSTLAVVNKAKGKMDSEIMKFGKFFWNLGDYVEGNKKSLTIRIFNEFYQLPEFRGFLVSAACGDSSVENLMLHINENKGKVSEKTSGKYLETATGVLGDYLSKIAAINTPYKSETKHIGGIGSDMDPNMLLSSLLYLRRWHMVDKKKEEAPILLIELQKEAPTAKKQEPMKY